MSSTFKNCWNIGYYSKWQDERYGHCVWENEQGVPTKATGIHDITDREQKFAPLGDNVGPMCKFISCHPK